MLLVTSAVLALAATPLAGQALAARATDGASRNPLEVVLGVWQFDGEVAGEGGLHLRQEVPRLEREVFQPHTSRAGLNPSVAGTSRARRCSNGRAARVRLGHFRDAFARRVWAAQRRTNDHPPAGPQASRAPRAARMTSPSRRSVSARTRSAKAGSAATVATWPRGWPIPRGMPAGLASDICCRSCCCMLLPPSGGLHLTGVAQVSGPPWPL